MAPEVHVNLDDINIPAIKQHKIQKKGKLVNAFVILIEFLQFDRFLRTTNNSLLVKYGLKRKMDIADDTSIKKSD